MIPSSFLFLLFFFIHIVSFIPISTSQLSTSVLSYRFGGKLNAVSALSVSGITVIPTNSISTPSTASTNTTLLSNNTIGKGPVYELRQEMGTPLVVRTENGLELHSVHSTSVPTPFVSVRVEPLLQPDGSSSKNISSTKTVNMKNETSISLVSSTVQLNSTLSKSASPAVDLASNSTVSHSVSMNSTHSSLPVNSTSTQPKPTSTGSGPSSSLSLVRKWDQECGGVSYSASFACYDKHYQDHFRFKDSSLWNVKSYFNSLIDTNPTPISEPCQSSNLISYSFIGFETFLNRHYSHLTKNCTDVHQYSHCQVYSLIEFNPFNQTCSSWHRQPCLSHSVSIHI